MSKLATIKMKADDSAEVLVYDVIGEDIFGGISAKEFRAQIKDVKAKSLNVRINSPGGSVVEGAAMMTALDEFKGEITVDIDSMAASAASVLAMAGDKVRMASNALMMIHDPYSMVMGGADEMRRTADLLDKVKGQIIDAYMRRSKKNRKELSKMMGDETWFTGAEAVAAGLADEATGAQALAASFDMSKFPYRKTPQLPAQMLATQARLTRLAALAGPVVRNAATVLKPRAQMEGGSPFDIGIGDCVVWFVEDESGMCAVLEDGEVEAIETGTLTIPGTALSLDGTSDDPAVRVCDMDDDDTTWYLVPMSRLRKMGDMDEGQMNGGMMSRAKRLAMGLE